MFCITFKTCWRYDSLTGWGIDGNIAFGPVNGGLWGSIDGANYKPTWFGTSIGIGFGVGGSGGVSPTWPVN